MRIRLRTRRVSARASSRVRTCIVACPHATRNRPRATPKIGFLPRARARARNRNRNRASLRARNRTAARRRFHHLPEKHPFILLSADSLFFCTNLPNKRTRSCVFTFHFSLFTLHFAFCIPPLLSSRNPKPETRDPEPASPLAPATLLRENARSSFRAPPLRVQDLPMNQHPRLLR